MPAEAPGAPQAAHGSPYLPDGTLWHRYISWGDLMVRAAEARRELYGDTFAKHPTPDQEYCAQLAWCLAAVVAMVRAEMEKK